MDPSPLCPHIRPGRGIISLLAAGLCLFATAATTAIAGDGTREILDLNDEWQAQKVADLDTPPASGAWKPFQVPGTFTGHNYERAWFKRTFSLPDGMRGKRIKIRFDGVKYNSRVEVNGIDVGGCLNGYDAFEVDVTHAVRFDMPNTLLVGCHDWTGVFSAGHCDMSEKPAWQRARRFVKDKAIAPIGGHYNHYGIWGDVTLEAHPAVYVKDIFIKPSVRNGELVIDYSIANESAQPVETAIGTAVEEEGRTVLQLPKGKVSIAPGDTTTLTVRQKWTDYRPWSHEDPWLYQLRTNLAGHDALRTRFGFREFWIDGHRYVLNGSKIDLLASSWWPPREGPMTREEVKQTWLALKEAGIKCFRTHTQPWRRVHYEVADEVGLLMIPEAPVWHDPYCTAYGHPAFWDNYEDSVVAMIQREKNTPSVVMWSMGNEIFGGGKEKVALAEKGLARVGRAAKKADPTRPIYFESDGDPEGVADAIGLHYIHEYPKHTCWPNEAYWLEKPFLPPTWQKSDGKPIHWKREKPLYLGEFLWVPSGTPAAHTVFFGDDAYRDLDLYTKMGKGEAWKMQILAFRYNEAGGISPWTVGDDDLTENNPLYRAHQYIYQPVAAFCLDYDRRFYAGEEVARRVVLFNDILSPSSLAFSWQLLDQDKVLDEGDRTIALEAGEKQMVPVTLQMPEAAKRTPLTWRLRIERKGKQVFEDIHEYAAFPPLRLPRPATPVTLFDTGDKSTAKLFSEAGVAFEEIDSLENIPAGAGLLVIGAGALSDVGRAMPVIGRSDPRRQGLTDFINRGGRVLVLRQEAYPEGLLGLDLTPHESTMTFPLRPRHPALQGIQADDLKFWRGDHLVTAAECPRPASGASIPIIVSGSGTGLAHAPLLERPAGKGTVVHCQMRLVEKARTEPTAGILLANLVDHLAPPRPPAHQTVLLGGDDTYKATLRELGLRFVQPADQSQNGGLPDASLVICRGEIPNLDQYGETLRRHVEQGGNLLVHRPSAAAMEALCRLLDINVTSKKLTATVRPASTDHPLADAISREDLYWSIKQPGLSWSRQPLSREMTGAIFAPGFNAGQARGFDANSWEIAGGPHIHKRADSVLFATAGTASVKVGFPEPGLYGIGIRARGTPCRGEYPAVEISFNGSLVGRVQLDGGDWQNHGIVAEVPTKDQHAITVAFVNDASNPPTEDRNLELATVFVDATPRDTSFVPLTQPAAVATHAVGSGTVVFDHLRWDTEESNRQKAMRHAASLLTALAADFTPRPGVTIPCETMTPNPEMKHFSLKGGAATLNANGNLSTTIRVAATGRYAVDIVASGNPCEDEYAIAEIHIDDKKAGQVQLTTGQPRSYSLDVPLRQGERKLRIMFVNDRATPEGGDRSLTLHTLTFYNE